jgi:hypothetical protein
MVEDVQCSCRRRDKPGNAAAAAVGHLDPELSRASLPEEDDVEIVGVAICELDDGVSDHALIVRPRRPPALRRCHRSAACDRASFEPCGSPGLKLISARVDKEAMLRVVFSISVAALAVAFAAFFRLPH